MLISKPIETGDIVALKPLTGPDIVGRLAATYRAGDTHVSIRRPIEAHVVQSQGGGLGLAFAPFSLCASDEQVFSIPCTSLMVDPFLARDEVKNTYLEQTTGLVTPPKPTIIT